jgi:hypothetical protein
VTKKSTIKTYQVDVNLRVPSGATASITSHHPFLHRRRRCLCNKVNGKLLVNLFGGLFKSDKSVVAAVPLLYTSKFNRENIYTLIIYRETYLASVRRNIFWRGRRSSKGQQTSARTFIKILKGACQNPNVFQGGHVCFQLASSELSCSPIGYSGLQRFQKDF